MCAVTGRALIVVVAVVVATGCGRSGSGLASYNDAKTIANRIGDFQAPGCYAFFQEGPDLPSGEKEEGSCTMVIGPGEAGRVGVLITIYKDEGALRQLVDSQVSQVCAAARTPGLPSRSGSTAYSYVEGRNWTLNLDGDDRLTLDRLAFHLRGVVHSICT
jgi:hypothetical protein